MVNVEGFTPRNADEVGSTGDFIGPGYFSTIEIPLLLGREIGARDEAGSPRVCVINEAFAKRFLAGRKPIGRHVSSPGIDDNRPMEIIGVSTNARVNSLRGKVEPKIYAASEQLAPAPSATFEVRTSVDPGRLSAPVRRAILSANADLEITSIESLRRVIDEQNTPSRLIASLCCLFGAVALLLAATGVYGVLSYRVSRRSREIGVRLALGASRGTVIAMILKETGFMIATGIALGVTAAAICAQILSTQLYGLQAQGPRWSVARYEHVDSATQLFGVKAMDPVIMGTAVLILGAVGMIAAALPALRAARTDPMRVLRHE